MRERGREIDIWIDREKGTERKRKRKREKEGEREGQI